jgi:hypothetical protein
MPGSPDAMRPGTIRSNHFNDDNDESRSESACASFNGTTGHHPMGNVCPRVTPAMQLGVTGHVWDLRELLKNLLTVTPCHAPEAQPLASRKPEQTHRELPNGRGFLRAIDGGKSSAKTPNPSGSTPISAPKIAPEQAPKGQLDLFAPRHDPKRDDDDDCPY